MITEPITIFTSNLLDKSTAATYSGASVGALYDNLTETVFTAPAGEAVTFSFHSPVKADTLLLKNINCGIITISYKAAASDNTYTAIGSFDASLKKDFLVTFPAVTVAEVKMVFNNTGPQISIGQIILCLKELELRGVLSSFTPSYYSRHGHHYTASGNLIKWRDFSKQTGSLRLANVNADLRYKLNDLLLINPVLTYIFYGSGALIHSGEYALSAPVIESMDRKTGLYEMELSLTGR